MRANRLIPIVAIGLLLLTAFAVPVQAQDDRGGRGPRAGDRASDHPSDRPMPDCSKAPDPERCQMRENRTAKREDRRENATAAFHSKCDAPANATVEERCAKVKDFMDGAHRAVREARFGLMAIHSLERQKVRLEIRLKVLQDRLGNSTDANATAKIQHHIDLVEKHLKHVDAKIAKLEDRLVKLREKFQDVREKVREHREGRGNATAPSDDAEPSEAPETSEPAESSEPAETSQPAATSAPATTSEAPDA